MYANNRDEAPIISYAVTLSYNPSNPLDLLNQRYSILYIPIHTLYYILYELFAVNYASSPIHSKTETRNRKQETRTPDARQR
jgi:hypothetical protein